MFLSCGPRGILFSYYLCTSATMEANRDVCSGYYFFRDHFFLFFSFLFSFFTPCVLYLIEHHIYIYIYGATKRRKNKIHARKRIKNGEGEITACFDHFSECFSSF